ncbi:hypothetical protein CRM22_004209 [Opisthorchis felineus]|uniref:Folate receptor-like domain-containing protein n=1 Tax=Opisthorchis felineus TaxID=147828 RepID=A0A4S2LY33_OPIFE|nr:hypothetical protein CRM22_004209 [Opisthorchis felineus]TGZ68529.1 hypothetical protein CRM22_004209 [Opisthorchis felineus]
MLTSELVLRGPPTPHRLEPRSVGCGRSISCDRSSSEGRTDGILSPLVCSVVHLFSLSSGNTMVAHSLLTVLLVVAANAYDNRLDEIRSVEDYLNICINGTHHKKAPSPEPTDDHICTDWASMSCCEHKTMRSVQDSLLYGFNHSHCKPMSQKCINMFKRELCFYECSPHVGPWLVKTQSLRRRERSYLVPLCEEDCNKWYEACKNEETCVRDWSVEFEWSEVCRKSSDHKTYGPGSQRTA